MQYKAHRSRLVDLVYACSYISVLVIISCIGWMLKYVEFPCYLRSASSGAQLCYPPSLSGDSSHIAICSFNIFLAFRCKFARKENEQLGNFGAVNILYFLVIRVFSSPPYPRVKNFLRPTPVTLFFVCQKANGQKVVRSPRVMHVVKSVFKFHEYFTFPDIHVCPACSASVRVRC